MSGKMVEQDIQQTCQQASATAKGMLRITVRAPINIALLMTIASFMTTDRGTTLPGLSPGATL